MPPAVRPDEDAREALRRAAADLDRAEAAGQIHAIGIALARVADCYRHLDALASAEACYEAALRRARAGGGSDEIVDLLCALAETAAELSAQRQADEPDVARAARERARDHVFEVGTLAGRLADPDCEAHVLLRISDVLECCGDHEDAARLQVRALRLIARGLAAATA